MNIVQGASAGSEAKGKLSAFLADKYMNDISALTMSASPNAGHTVVVGAEKFVTYHLPASAVACPDNIGIYLGPASLINTSILFKEIEETGINPERILIDPRAAIITPELIQLEHDAKLSDIGSTLQGIGETRIAKIRRDGSVTLAKDCTELLELGVVSVKPVAEYINDIMDNGGTVLHEMTQGFDLDLEHGIDPRYCTSKMINPAMGMAEMGVSPHRIGHIYGVLRPYPIRVNNRTGTSGPYADGIELEWKQVAMACKHPDPDSFGEITTTTKLPRRIFTFSWERFNHFIRVARPDFLCLQFANYLNWEDFGRRKWHDLSVETRAFVGTLERNAGRSRVAYIGTGPEHDDMVDLRVDSSRL